MVDAGRQYYYEVETGRGLRACQPASQASQADG